MANRLRRVCAWLIFVIVLAGCSIDEDPHWTTLVLAGGDVVAINDSPGNDADGHLVMGDDGRSWGSALVLRDFPDRWSDEFDELDVIGNELCLRSNRSVCIRTDGERILESVDGGQSWNTAWELNTSGGWLNRQFSRQTAVELETGSVYETESGAVVAAVGFRPPIRRSVDGEWTPSEADLRLFPKGGAITLAVAFVLLAIAVARNPINSANVLVGLLVGVAAFPYFSMSTYSASLGVAALSPFALLVAIMFDAGLRRLRTELPKRPKARWRLHWISAVWLLLAAVSLGSIALWAIDAGSWTMLTMPVWIGTIGALILTWRVASDDRVIPPPPRGSDLIAVPVPPKPVAPPEPRPQIERDVLVLFGFTFLLVLGEYNLGLPKHSLLAVIVVWIAKLLTEHKRILHFWRGRVAVAAVVPLAVSALTAGRLVIGASVCVSIALLLVRLPGARAKSDDEDSELNGAADSPLSSAEP